MVMPADENPYEVMTSLEPMADAGAEAVVEHGDFELHGGGLLCRSGLRLPAYCLHTGRPTGLSPFPMTLIDMAGNRAASLGRIFKGVLIGLLILIAAGGVSLRLGAVTGLSVGVLTMALTLVLVFVLVYLWQRRVAQPVTCKLTGFVTTRRLKLLTWLRLMPMCGLLLSLVIRMTWSDTVANLSLFLVFVLQFVINRMYFRGERLSCQQFPDGRFYITGFTPVFLQQLSRESSKSPDVGTGGGGASRADGVWG